MGVLAGSLGGGIGAGKGAGAGMEVPAVSDSVDGGKGGSWNEDEEARRPPWEELAKDARRSEAIVGKSVRIVVQMNKMGDLKR